MINSFGMPKICNKIFGLIILESGNIMELRDNKMQA
jgi:hypothetical protein